MSDFQDVPTGEMFAWEACVWRRIPQRAAGTYAGIVNTVCMQAGSHDWTPGALCYFNDLSGIEYPIPPAQILLAKESALNTLTELSNDFGFTE